MLIVGVLLKSSEARLRSAQVSLWVLSSTFDTARVTFATRHRLATWNSNYRPTTTVTFFITVLLTSRLPMSNRQTLGECQSGELVAIMRLLNAQRSFWYQLKGAGQSDKPELERIRS